MPNIGTSSYDGKTPSVIIESPVTQEEIDFYKQVSEGAANSDERNIEFVDEPR